MKYGLLNTFIASLKNSSDKRFFDNGNSEWCPERDFYLCTDVNKFNFVLRAEKDKNGLLCFYRV